MQHGEPKEVTYKYKKLLEDIESGKSVDFVVELDDVYEFDDFGAELAHSIIQNTARYVELFSLVVEKSISLAKFRGEVSSFSPVDMMISHRLARLQARHSNPGGEGEGVAGELDYKKFFPPQLIRKFNVLFKTLTKGKVLSVRQVKASHLGTLIRLRGVVTRCSEVKPLLIVATYTCEKCGNEIYQETPANAFMPLLQCPSEECQKNNTKGQLFMQTRGCRFQKFQEVRVQELADQVPVGHIPRGITVNLYESNVRKLSPGDHVIITGIYMPRPYTGMKAIRAGLLTDSYLLGMDIFHLKEKYLQQTLSSELQQKILSLPTSNPSIFAQLAKSIAPEIYGHEDVKKALLLMMVGGVTKSLADGMRIRGDINCCLVGDPGVAKSQLLKFIAKCVPRGVYTTGKGSSGVGLTAAVTKDQSSGELVLEGGALVLADNGICCIDEFDKMEDSDRTAIHEVMEQQTISISKAGITTTLNARSAILAAANPLSGRFNLNRPLTENINLPPALLSRFDLLFLLLDRPSLEDDTQLAQHVTQVHRTGSATTATSKQSESDSEQELFSPEFLRQYIAMCKRIDPVVPSALVDYISNVYVGMRANDSWTKSSYTTPRTLLGILRLSQAIARVHFCAVVRQSDVDEAVRLMEASKASVLDAIAESSSLGRRYHKGGKAGSHADLNSRIFSLLKDAVHEWGSEDGQVSLTVVYEQLKQANVTHDQIGTWLDEFCQAGLIRIDGDMLVMF